MSQPKRFKSALLFIDSDSDSENEQHTLNQIEYRNTLLNAIIRDSVEDFKKIFNPNDKRTIDYNNFLYFSIISNDSIKILRYLCNINFIKIKKILKWIKTTKKSTIGELLTVTEKTWTTINDYIYGSLDGAHYLINRDGIDVFCNTYPITGSISEEILYDVLTTAENGFIHFFRFYNHGRFKRDGMVVIKLFNRKRYEMCQQLIDNGYQVSESLLHYVFLPDEVHQFVKLYKGEISEEVLSNVILSMSVETLDAFKKYNLIKITPTMITSILIESDYLFIMHVFKYFTTDYDYDQLLDMREMFSPESFKAMKYLVCKELMTFKEYFKLDQKIKRRIDENTNSIVLQSKKNILYDAVCCICLIDFIFPETVLKLPCNHIFHHHCIYMNFLYLKTTCPKCKKDIE